MDIQQYIDSGILELYAAGALSISEAAEVEANVSKYPELRSELDAINASLESYTMLYRKNPRPGLRAEILEKIEEDDTATPSNIYSLREKSAMAGSYQKRYSRMKYLLAAVIVVLVFNVLMNFLLLNKWQTTDSRMVALDIENGKLRNEYILLKSRIDKKTEDMQMVMNRTNKIVDLKGMEKSPQAFATVYWNPLSRHVMLNVESLPLPPSGKQYQLWAIKDGKPIDAGVFDIDPDPMHKMKTEIANADAFAVTLENIGGSPSPTMDQMYLMGKF